MTDISTLPTLELLTRAADAAGQAASAATEGPWERVLTDRVQSSVWRRDVVDGTTYEWKALVADCDSGMEEDPDPDADQANARLIAASNPDHWRAVETLIRKSLRWHDPGFGHCITCGRGDPADCSLLLLLRALAEQVLRDLGAA